MNTAIFLTKSNKLDMEQSIELLAKAQETKINGALVIVYQTAITRQEAQRIAGPLIPKFTTTSAVESAANLSRSEDAQIATMFARFVLLAYSRYPGAWLILDEPVSPTCQDWHQAMAKLHGANGGKAVGCAVQDGKTLLTKGPLTLQLPWQTMKLFRFATNEGWRSRGRYLLVGAGFRPVSALEMPLLPLGYEIIETVIVGSPEVAKMLVPVEDSPSEDGREAEEREELMNLIEKATGKRPHHFTGIDKLRKMSQQLDQPAQA